MSNMMSAAERNQLKEKLKKIADAYGGEVLWMAVEEIEKQPAALIATALTGAVPDGAGNVRPLPMSERLQLLEAVVQMHPGVAAITELIEDVVPDDDEEEDDEAGAEPAPKKDDIFG